MEKTPSLFRGKSRRLDISRSLYAGAAFCALAACASPNQDAALRFASGLDAAAVGVNEAFAGANKFVAEEKVLDQARIFALRESVGPDGSSFVNLAPPEPLVPPEIVKSRKLALDSLQIYARLLLELSDGSLSASFSKEIDGFAADVQSFQKRLQDAGAPEAIAGFQLSPVASALDFIGRKLIEAKAAAAIAETASAMQPQIDKIVETLKADLAYIKRIETARLKNNEAVYETVLAVSPERSPTKRFELYLDYSGLYAERRAQLGGIDRLTSALSAMPTANAALIDPERDEARTAVATFVRLADLTADFYIANFKEK